MALIKCKECGKDISDKAAVCPNCGCPILIEKQNCELKETNDYPAKKHSILGIIGFALSIMQAIIGFHSFINIALCIISCLLCSIGWMQKDKKHIFAIIGNAISLLFLFSYIFLIAVLKRSY